MNTPAIQEGGCTKLPTLPRNGPPDLVAIPISGAALVSGVALLAGVLAGIVQVVDATGGGGAIIAVVALAMSIAGLTKSGARWEKALAAAACLTAVAALGLAVLM